jgi:hypothetical protein
MHLIFKTVKNKPIINGPATSIIAVDNIFPLDGDDSMNGKINPEAML